MIRAHELAAALAPESAAYRSVMASIKFDLGELDEVATMAMASSRTFYELPAPTSLFEMRSADGGVFWFLAQDVEIGTEWRSFLKIQGDPSVWCSELVILVMRDGLQKIARQGADGHTEQVVQLAESEQPFFDRVMVVAEAIEVFSCCNVKQIEHEPPKFLNAKRIAKGKTPFFTYRTLLITGEGSQGGGPAAEGKSPRLHLRRGHIRRLASDRRIWVRAHLVGDKSQGFANKDFAVQLS